MAQACCDACAAPVTDRQFSRRGVRNKRFCSISCVEAFETRSGMPNGRIDETRQGWSPFATPAALQPC